MYLRHHIASKFYKVSCDLILSVMPSTIHVLLQTLYLLSHIWSSILSIAAFMSRVMARPNIQNIDICPNSAYHSIYWSFIYRVQKVHWPRQWPLINVETFPRGYLISISLNYGIYQVILSLLFKQSKRRTLQLKANSIIIIIMIIIVIINSLFIEGYTVS